MSLMLIFAIVEDRKVIQLKLIALKDVADFYAYRYLNMKGP